MFAWLVFNNLPQVEEILETLIGDGEDRIYFFFIVHGWNSLKCVSFVVDKMKDGSKGLHYTMIDFLGYCFYPPTMFVGPAVMFERHRTMLLNYGRKEEMKVLKRSFNLLRSLLYCYGLYLFTHFCLHFLYINHFQVFHKQVSVLYFLLIPRIEIDIFENL